MTRRILFILLVGVLGCTNTGGPERVTNPTQTADGGVGEACESSDKQWVSGRDFTQTKPEGWEATCFYPTQLRAKGRYLNKQFDPFEVTVDTSNPEDFAYLTPYEVAELVYWMTAAHALMDLPCSINRTPYELLSKGHFVVVDDRRILEQLYRGDHFTPNTTAFIRGNIYGACYEAPEDVYWTSVIMNHGWNRDDVGLVVHEMTHIVSMAVNGHSDPEHLDPRLWRDAGGNESLQALVIGIHDCTYFPDSCANLSKYGMPSVDD